MNQHTTYIIYNHIYIYIHIYFYAGTIVNSATTSSAYRIFKSKSKTKVQNKTKNINNNAKNIIF